MTKLNDEQLDSALQEWQRRQVGMPASVRRQIQRQLHQSPTSLWRRHWRETVSLLGCAFVALIWWQLAHVPDQIYQVVVAEENGHLIEIHQLLRAEPSATPRSAMNQQRRVAYTQRYEQYRHDAAHIASKTRLMQVSVDADDVILTDCLTQQVRISRELWQAWRVEQGLPEPMQPNWFEVSQGQQGQILALQQAPAAAHCPAP